MFKAIVIGAKRRRQGIGAYVARSLTRAGVRVSAVVGTTEASAREAADALAHEAALELRGYAQLDEALEEEAPDLVAICSPFDVHREHLALTARSGCHCLCEKPLWWDDGAMQSATRSLETERLVDAFVDRGRYLAMITQWPCTLPGFYTLYPDLRGAALESFQMHLAPSRSGYLMVLDSAPHPLSMLQRLVGAGEATDARATYVDAGQRDMRIEFRYRHAAGEVDVGLRFSTKEQPPRPASYEINGRRVDRRIILPAYDMVLEAEKRSVPIEDPLDCLTRDFVRRLESGASLDRQALVESITALEVLVEAAREPALQ